jgi:predicted anti-sigma-YlaC factor YlaD
MPVNLWLGYWWILPPLLYLILLVVLVRRGMWETTGTKIMLATTCALILFLPFMHRPLSYATAVLIVISVLILFRAIIKPGLSIRPSDE